VNFYSQYGQDKWLYENFFKDKKSGTFLEIGADDGIDKSNTLFFEKYLGWNGICVEPSPDRYKLLSKNRNCICEQTALSSYTGTAEFLDISGWGKGLSGIVDNYCDNHSRRVSQEIRHPDNLGSKKIKVPVDTLNNVLAKYNVFEVDFCTIDTEGSEFQILKDFDFDKFKIQIILVENNYGDDKITNLLHSKGYKMITKLRIDDVYVLEKENFNRSIK